MKIKNMTMALLSTALAVGSAFMSFYTPESVYVRAKLSFAPAAATVCKNTEVECDNTGNVLCTVNFANVMNTVNGSQIQTGTVISPLRWNCTTELRHTTGVAQSSGIVIYRLVLNSEP
jgi:hypothetical protein